MNRGKRAQRGFAWRGLVLAAVLQAAMSARADAATVQDAAGRAVVIEDTSRIVSVGGAITEILYALGLEKRVVAVDTTSVYPLEALRQKPNVGYMRALSAEGVLGLSPSLILAAEGAGPKEVVSVIEASHIPFVSVPDHFTGQGIVDKINLLASATGADARGACLVRAVKGDLDAVAAMRARIAKPLKVLFLLSFMNNRPMVAGRHTAADGVIALAGGVNAMADFDGYKIVNDEAIIAAKPDVVLAMRRPDLKLGADEIFSQPAFAMTPAADGRRFVAMDGLYLLGFGPRTARAARDLAGTLYPDIGKTVLPSDTAPTACP
ncbi:MAG: hemin ABC transporter substrate-binding protein [Pseudorhodoplanes sp.]